MPVITYFICKTGHKIFLQCFYDWIVVYYNNQKQNLIHPL